MSHEKERRERMKELLKILENCVDKTEYKFKLAAVFAVQWGITDRKVLEYINTLENAGYIEELGAGKIRFCRALDSA